MSLSVLVQHARDTEVSQHQFRMILVAEEEVTGLDILMQDIALMTIGQSGSTHQGDAAELVKIAIQTILRQRAAPQVFHQFIITVLAVNIGLTEVIDSDDHFKTEVIDGLKDLLVHVEVRIVNLQHIFFPVTFHQEDLCLSGVLAQDAQAPVVDTLQDKAIILDIICRGVKTVSSRRSIK